MSASPRSVPTELADGLDPTVEVADAYRDAALAQTDLRRATEAFEAVREAFAADPRGMDGWDVLDREIGRAEPKPLKNVLVELRGRLIPRLFALEVERLHAVADPEARATEWLRTYASALRRW